ncbi:MAG TPA: hypothetical protein PK079_03155 [Leptospiraceae bacterium]|nr:hypothetical protein [Leptospiraceae bacterium]HMW04410.1 hypothetical protein [Leptospiraceae bacterium]HMX31538.1 hypothetical protein [Leptospiraceae bacterium]HMY30596.1 hypothetical protein [Leptospiraceae bacterium]HMZ64463.1 hypothetical protein [Leptospiraceae bacterium]
MKLKKFLFILFLTIFFVTFSNAGCSGCSKEKKDKLIEFVVGILKQWADDCSDGIQHNPLCPKPPASSVPCLCEAKPCTTVLIGAKFTDLNCTPGKIRGYRQYDSAGNEIPGGTTYDWITLDKFDGEANKCGVAYGEPKQVFQSACTNGRKSIQENQYLQGYDLLSGSPPVGVKSTDPQNAQVIFESQQMLTIYFQNTVKSDNLQFSGDLSLLIDPNYKFTRTTDFNDTLQIKSSSKWSLGSFRSLNLSLFDIDDKPVSISLFYHIIKDGTSKLPSFYTCVSPECKLSWQSAYAIQLEANGGVPPYKWYTINDIPTALTVSLPPGFGPGLPPGASVSREGLLSGPATNNFYATYYFGILVVDSIGQTYPAVVVIDTTDLVAQYAACLLTGFCP